MEEIVVAFFVVVFVFVFVLILIWTERRRGIDFFVFEVSVFVAFAVDKLHEIVRKHAATREFFFAAVEQILLPAKIALVSYIGRHFVRKFVLFFFFLNVFVVFSFFLILVIFSLFLNEVRFQKFKGTIQSVSFLPYFISSAVMVSIMYTVLSPTSGIVNNLIVKMGGESVNFMAKPEWFRPIYIFLQIWQMLGYNAVIYMAGIASINGELYEAAEVDGCGRWGKMIHVTLPGISTSVITMLIISIGNIFTVDTDRILLLYNASNAATSDVIQSYVYRIAFQSLGFPDYSYGTAVNIVKSLLAFILVIIANKLADKYAETRLF